MLMLHQCLYPFFFFALDIPRITISVIHHLTKLYENLPLANDEPNQPSLVTVKLLNPCRLLKKCG